MSILSKIFKSKLNQRQFEFKEEYWKGLEKNLDAHGAKGGTNYVRWFFYSIGIATIISFGVWVFYPKADKAQMAVMDLPEGEKKAEINGSTRLTVNSSDSLTASGENGNSPTDNHSNLVEEKEKDNNRKVVSVEKESGINAHFPSEMQKKNNSIKLKPGSEKRSSAIAGNEIIPGENKPGTKPGVINEGAIIALRDEASATEPQENLLPDEEISIGKKESINDISASAFIENAVTREEKLSDYNSFEPGNKGITASADIKTPMIMMGKIFSSPLKNRESELKTIAFENKIRRRKNNFFAGLYSGVMYTDKILKANYDTLGKFVSRRKNEESRTLSKNFGADFGIGQDCWNISIGINYHQQGEVVDYKPEFYQWLKNSASSWNIVDNSYWKYDTVNTLSYTVTEGSWQMVDTTIGYWSNNVYVPNDTISIQQYVVDSEYIQTIYVTDSNYVSKFDSTENTKIDSAIQLVNDPSLKPEKTTTKISYFEFPVMIGYEFPISRVTLMVRTGFSIGLLSKINATYLKSDISGTEPVDITKLNKTMLNYLLRAGVLFYITENTVINFEPMFRMNVNSVFKDTGFTQQYWNAGLNLGVMYRF